jgi:hypothetical protein
MCLEEFVEQSKRSVENGKPPIIWTIGFLSSIEGQSLPAHGFLSTYEIDNALNAVLISPQGALVDVCPRSGSVSFELFLWVRQ